MSVDALKAGYVLHQRPYRSTSLLVEILTAEAGRVGLVARGARKQGARRGAPLQPFQPLLLAWRGRGELKTLTAVEDAGERRSPPAGPALFAGYYCNELVLRLCARGAADATVFAAYQRVVDALRGEAVPRGALRVFELELLTALGYAPALTEEADTGRAISDAQAYDFLPETGPMRVTAAEPRPGAVRVSGAHLRALAERDFDDAASLAAARRVLHAAIDPLLGSRPLKSREIYRRLYGSSGAGKRRQ